MRAVLCPELTGLESLSITEVAPPTLCSGGVRIAVHAAGVNFADLLITSGAYQLKPPLPFTPGGEVAGVVLECAAGVSRCRPDDRVLAVLEWGGYAEQVVAPERDVFALPDGMDFVTAAGFLTVYGTSHLGLTHMAALQPGEVLLVHGAAGGVGLTAVEIGKVMGATVIATAGSADKLQIARDAGADHLINYATESIRERVKSLTGGQGADVVYDPVGGSAFTESLRCINWGGRLLIVGFASGTVPQIPANILLVKNVAALGYHWGSYRNGAPDLFAASVAELFQWYAQGKLHPHVSHRLPLSDAAAALTLLRDRKSTGKVVLVTKGGEA